MYRIARPKKKSYIRKSRRLAQLLQAEECGEHDSLNIEICALEDNNERALNTRKKRSQVSCREYYCYKLQIRCSGNSILLHAGRLLQQYVVDMYVKIETARLDYFRNNQKQIRAELYQGIVDSVEIGETRGYKIGRKIILPSSFTGGPRDMKKRYMDAMALVQRYG
ncbi:Helitron helicase-like domain containing protein [Abeliophyllum distichum]|uniref:Helitron helicase-like domain containing protein n=1 Tax=Abeliophyllum distichum TaxID=126358 RepID=A0ABD1VRB5_9LAMI